LEVPKVVRLSIVSERYDDHDEEEEIEIVMEKRRRGKRGKRERRRGRGAMDFNVVAIEEICSNAKQKC